jgi:hypothetical protein
VRMPRRVGARGADTASPPASCVRRRLAAGEPVAQRGAVRGRCQQLEEDEGKNVQKRNRVPVTSHVLETLIKVISN